MAISAAPMAGAIAAIAASSLPCANIAVAAWCAATSPPPPIAGAIVSPAPAPPAATSATATGGLIDHPGGSGSGAALFPAAQHYSTVRNHLFRRVFQCLGTEQGLP